MRATRATTTIATNERVGRARGRRRRPRARRAGDFVRARFGRFATESTARARDGVKPGKGPGSPPYSEIYDYLTSSRAVREASIEDVRAVVRGRRRGAVIDVRQPLEHEEWRLSGTKSAPFLVPMSNQIRRASGYFLSIKGGLKERNASFIERVDEFTNGSRR